MTARGAVFASAGIAFLVHLPAIGGEFVYDDERFVVRNPAIESLENAPRYFTDLETTSAPDRPTGTIYRPIRTLSYALLTAVAGKEPEVFHLLGLLLHASTAALLAGLLLAAGLAGWSAFFGAALYALHPAVVESTAWISSLGDLWCGAFAAGSVLLHARGRTAGALALLVLALLSKEHAVIVPLLWGAWDAFFDRPRLRRTLLAGVLPGMALAGAFLFVRGEVVGAQAAQTAQPLGGSVVASVLTMLSGFGYYAARILFPAGATFGARIVDQQSVTVPVVLGLCALAAVVAGVFAGSRRTRLASAWFLIALVPVSNVLVPLKIPTADRFLYIPLMALGFLSGEVFERVAPRTWAARAGWALPLFLAALTWQRIGDFRDAASLNGARREANPKGLEGIWADAALEARRALEALAEKDHVRAHAHMEEALDLYRAYWRNQRPDLTDVSLFEAGTLLWRLARADESGGWGREARVHDGAAAELLARAHAFHARGLGTAAPAVRVQTAERLLELAIRLAVPENPHAGDAVNAGLRAASYLFEQTGEEPIGAIAQLYIAKGEVIALRAPEEARRVLEAALEGLRKVERDRGAPTHFERARAHFALAMLGDRPYERERFVRAYDLFLESVREVPHQATLAKYRAGVAACRIGIVFREDEWVERGRAHLREAAEADDAPDWLLDRIAQEDATCRPR